MLPLQSTQRYIPNQTLLPEEISTAKDNLGYYAELIGFPPSWHHSNWLNLLEDKSNSKLVVLAPRNHAKSTDFSIIYPSWEIGNRPQVRIIIVSSAASQSQAFLRSIKYLIEDEPNYFNIFGNLKPDRPEKWTEREVIVNRPITKEKDPTVSTLGAGGAILSKRADIIICDDILNKENTRTPEQRQKLKEWFTDVLMPVLEPNGGRFIWVSTAFNLEDLSHDLFKDPTVDVKIKYRAILNEAIRQDLWQQYSDLLWAEGKKSADEFYKNNEKEMIEGSQVLWTDRFNYKKLFDERISLGTRSFNLMYQNEAISDETAVIREAWVEQCKDESRRLVDRFNQSVYDISIQIVTQGADLAISESEMANETVITTLGLTKDNKIILLNGIGGRWSPGEIRANIKGQNDRFSPAVILVENNAFQASMVRDLQETSIAPIRGFTTTDEKFDEFVGINSIAVALENKQIILPADPRDPRTLTFYEKLKHDMISFPSGHTGDYLMSFWFAFTAIRNIKSSTVVAVKSKGR